MNIIAKIVATLKYIERVNWCVSKGREDDALKYYSRG